jgi:hypothetical protein
MKDKIVFFVTFAIHQLRRPQAWLVVAFFVMLVAYGILTNPGVFAYDARYYWELRLSFYDSERNFSLLNFADERFQLRGYFFPLVLLVSEWVIDVLTPDRWVDDSAIVVILNSVFMLLISWALIPAIFSRLTRRKSSLLFQVALSILLAFFWRGQLYYPLSDIPALFFLLAGLLLVLVLFQLPEGWKNTAAAFLAGALLMAVYLIRPVYLLVFVTTALGIAFVPAALKLRQRLLSIFAFLVAGALVLTPQYLINRIHYGINSPFISGGLYSYQITVGFLVQRYEASMDKNVYPAAGVRFMDPQAENLLLQEGRKFPFDTRAIGAFDVDSVLQNAFSIHDIFHFFLKYPLDIATIYFRHLFNGLNLIYPTTYIENIYRPAPLLMWLNYTVLFGVLFFFDARQLVSKNPPLHSLILLVWLLPALAALPSAMEARYFLPLHALLEACFVWMAADFTTLKAKIEQFGSLRLLFLYVIFVLMAFSLSGLILTSVPQANLLLTPR